MSLQTRCSDGNLVGECHQGQQACSLAQQARYRPAAICSVSSRRKITFDLGDVHTSVALDLGRDPTESRKEQKVQVPRRESVPNPVVRESCVRHRDIHYEELGVWEFSPLQQERAK